MSIATPALSARTPIQRSLRKWDLVALVLNSVIGAGIFGLPARAFALAGVYSLLAYVVCGVLVFLIVLCFAEVGSRFNETGGLYLYARATFGSMVGFEIGWLAWLARVTSFAALCNLFMDYLSYFLPAAATGPVRMVGIVITVSGLSAANVAGVRLASRLGNFLTVGKILPLTLLLIAGAFFVNPKQYSPASFPGYTALSASVLLLTYAFTGFEMAAIPAGESRDPRRHLPFALVMGTVTVALLYLAIQAVCIGTLPELAKSQRPLADAGGLMFGAVGATLISFGALVSILGTMSATMLVAPRLLFAMAEQRQLPRVFSATNHQFRTPHVAILISTAVMLALSLSGTFASAATISTIIRLTTYAVTCAALPVLRWKKTQEAATFIVPGGNVVATGALILIAWLLFSGSWSDVRQVLIASGAGLIFYAVYSKGRR